VTKRITLIRMGAPVAVAAGWLVFSSPAHADAPGPAPSATAAKPKAAELFKSGEAKYKAADYAGALADFTAADAQVPSVEAARYIGLSEDKLGHFRAAAAAYNRFLAHPPAKLVEDVGPLVVRVREIEQMPGTVRIVVEPKGATLTIDGAPERATAPYETHLAPGKHLVRASAPDHEALEREVNVTFASTEEVALTLADAPAVAVPPPPAPSPPPPPPPVPQITVMPSAPPPHPISRRTVAFIAAGVAVAGAGLATTLGVLALNNKSAYGRNPTLSNADDGNNEAAYADGAIALTIAAAVTSVVLFVTDETPSAPATGSSRTPSVTIAASPFVTPHGGGAGALLRF
jgi:hypothetical protein